MGLPFNIDKTIAKIQALSKGHFNLVTIGDVSVSCLTDLSAPQSVEITTRMVESGYPLSYSAYKNPIQLEMTVVLVTPRFSIEAGIQSAISGTVAPIYTTWQDDRDLLYRYLDTYELITVQTHDGIYSDMVIVGIDPKYDVDENYDAFIADVSLSQVRSFGTNQSDSTDIDKKLYELRR